MSSIRIVNQTPHYVRYGRTDASKGESWIRFWREATCFEVTIQANNIEGTAFHDEHKKALERVDRDPGVTGRGVRWPVQWEAFCDCILRFVLPTLEELAKDRYRGGRRWVTLEDYLQTPKYKLILRAPNSGDARGDAVVQVDQGPTSSPALDLLPLPFERLPVMIPSDMNRVNASSLKVLDHDKDIRCSPYKVRMLNGIEAYFIPAKRDTSFQGKPPINTSIRQMTNYLLWDQYIKGSDLIKEERAHFPMPLAIVSTPTKTEKTEPEPPLQGTESPKSQLAGMLIEFVKHAHKLWDRECLELIAAHEDSNEVVARLEDEIRSTVQRLHNQAPPIGHGGISSHNVLIVAEPRTSWSDVDLRWYLCEPRVADEEDKDYNPVEKDLAGLENIFAAGGWLKTELDRIRQEKAQSAL